MDKIAPAFEVAPSVHYDDVSKKWYAACTLLIHGQEQQRAVYTDAGFENIRRAKQFARFCAGKMEWDMKQRAFKELERLGKGLIKHE